MSVAELLDALDPAPQATRMHALMAELLPICRSITGAGVRQTLRAVAERIPLVVHEVPSGTPVYDWTVPLEWNVRDAYIADPAGRRLVDFQESPLHLVSYSVPVRARLSSAELRPHLHTMPDRPGWVPYRTSYYSRDWGFCLSDSRLQTFPEGPYDVVVDTTLEPGSLTYGECVVPGSSAAEVLISTHVCHPAMANDNLTGIAMATALASMLVRSTPHYTYRFVFVPGTIGSLSWLSRNEAGLSRIRHGLVLTGLGGPGPLVYKRTRHGDRAVDRAAAHVVSARGGEVRGFDPYGYDERQYNSPGFDLPVGRLTRTPHGEYPEYHTSADDLDLVRSDVLADSLVAVFEVLDVLENDATFVNLSPYGEPQLGRRGLYPTIGGKTAEDQVMAMLWTLNQSDGRHSILEVAERSGLPFAALRRAAAALTAADLLGPSERSGQTVLPWGVGERL